MLIPLFTNSHLVLFGMKSGSELASGISQDKNLELKLKWEDIKPSPYAGKKHGAEAKQEKNMKPSKRS